MKNQYFGDVNDYKKYSFIRLLGGYGKLATTICWALTEDDGRSDGGKIGYLEKPEEWECHDPAIFHLLRTSVVDVGQRRLDFIERSGVLSNCRFFSDLLPFACDERDAYFAKLLRFSQGSDLLFFDPDNGLGVASAPRGSRNSSKYVYPDEVGRAYRQGHSVLVYQHYPRRSRGPFLTAWAEQFSDLSDLRRVISFSTSHVAFILLPQARHEDQLLRSAALVAEKWGRLVKVQIDHPSPLAEAATGVARLRVAPAS